MNRNLILIAVLLLVTATSCSQSSDSAESSDALEDLPEAEWKTLFTDDLSDATFPEGVWYWEDSTLTATEDQAIWTNATYDNFELELEFKNAEGTNSGVFVYAEPDNWLTNSVEIQIADDYDPKWANSSPNWQCGAIFGHQAATAQKVVKRPGEWNTYRIVCQDQNIQVYLNDKLVNDADMGEFTSENTNPDGTATVEWLSVPMAELPTQGHVGFQGKHAGKPIWFRNLRIREI